MPLKTQLSTSAMVFAGLSIIAAAETGEDQFIVVGQDTIVITSGLISDEQSECGQTKQVYCYRKKPATDTQTIFGDCEPCGPLCSDNWFTDDVTFDGIPEIMHLATPGSTNEVYEAWRWDEALLKFICIKEDLANYRVNRQRETVESYWKHGPAPGIITTLKWTDNKFRVIGNYDYGFESGMPCSTVYAIPDCTMVYRRTYRSREDDTIGGGDAPSAADIDAV